MPIAIMSSAIMQVQKNMDPPHQLLPTMLQPTSLAQEPMASHSVIKPQHIIHSFTTDLTSGLGHWSPRSSHDDPISKCF